MEFRKDTDTSNSGGVQSPRGKFSRAVARVRNARMFTSFNNKNYRLYFMGSTGQWISMAMQMVVNPLLAYRITGSTAILGTISLVGVLPSLAVCLVGGITADRIPKKNIIMLGQVAIGILSLLVALSLVMGYMGPQHPESWWILLVQQMFMGVINAFSGPASQAIIPEIVGRENTVNATSLSNLGSNIFQLGSAAVAGVLIEFMGYESVFYVIAGFGFVSALFIWFVPVSRSVHSTVSAGAVKAISEGWKYTVRNSTLRYVIIFTIIFIFLAMPLQTLLPVFTEDILKVGSTGLGLLMSVAGVGALIVLLIIASLRTQKRGYLLLISSLITGVLLFAFAFSRSWPLSLILMGFIGMSRTANMNLGMTLFQTYSESQYLGRVFSIVMMGIGLSQIGTFAAGLFAEKFGVQMTIGAYALVIVLVTLLFWLFLPVLRKIE